ncbi:hypothetical protein IEQ34_016112 [Dendrobium chrysotoxum]|uniref:Uncharacterized protein n=1 Tax=Dendrobium chrysotoxum TaxID=161865 RepID=A0AAV7GFK9_DENCH|nr:hypothetical protein IEQ34_016112 [Dendrobium chrysotoxum]
MDALPSTALFLWIGSKDGSSLAAKMKGKLVALTFAERCKNILAANCQAYLNTIKADAKGSKDDIHTSRIHYMLKKGKPYIWVKEGDLHNVNVIIDERGSLAVSAVVPGSIMRLLRSMGKAPARVALAGDVVPLKDNKVQALSEGLLQHLEKVENCASHSSYAVSALLSSAGINCKSRMETFLEILDQNSNYVAHKFNISYVDGSGNIHDVEVGDVQAPKADLLFPFAEKLIDGINQSQPRRRALMLFCLEYYNAHARDALMLSIDQYGFDVLAKVSQSMTSNIQSLEYVWKEFRFSFKEEASDLETFCNLLIGLEEEVLQSVRSYSGLH